MFTPGLPDHVTCPNYWWRNILYIQTWFPFPQLCMLWSWYLADDMQFYVWAIVILIFSKRYVSWINVDKSFRCHKISIASNIRWNMKAEGLTAVLMFQNLMSMALPFVSNVYQILSVYLIYIEMFEFMQFLFYSFHMSYSFCVVGTVKWCAAMDVQLLP